MSVSFCRFLIQSKTRCGYGSVSQLYLQYYNIVSPCVLALDSYQSIPNGTKISLLSELYDGLLFTQRNHNVPSKSNHGAMPCSHIRRHIKVECKWYGPRWWRKRLKKTFRNSENKIHP
eukprot:553014_1